MILYLKAKSFNPAFIQTQGLIYNKRGAEGTIEQSLIAPSDYSPGAHPDQVLNKRN